MLLDAPRKRRVQYDLCTRALRVWERYAHAQPPMMYHDSVIGMRHTVDIWLPRAALASVAAGQVLANVSYRYAEPIAALQDDDLVFPDPIAFAYYAIYNLFQQTCHQAAIDDWRIVQQALAAEGDDARAVSILGDAIVRMRRAG